MMNITKKNILFQNGVAFILEMHFEAGYDTQQTNNNGVSESSTDNKIVYDYTNKNENPYQIKITRKMAKTIN